MNVLEKKNGQGGLQSELIAEVRNSTLTESQKLQLIEEKFRDIMMALGLDVTDESLKDTPRRVAKMYVKEVFSGLDPANAPAITLFKNDFSYDEMLIERNIPVYSYCEHHFVPIIGKVHVAYMSKGEVIGLSKLNRIVHYFAKRPQVQERLTIQIAEYLKKVMGIDDVAVVMDAEHLCVASRGVRDTGSTTITSSFHGRFLEVEIRKEFMSLLSV
ncbi:GTP cyclohydrolase I FolE [Polluticoccus soli]|uniref:GTP cyclohydrolase I FolE n=1 Tax=Polluticoccus soli TaxID=3034150 RepID=UPI0023E31DD4|nr:GTP cyclohydrolase I FolE [Flavipsychrobacter sp. JY13-12]